jgi:hypothetical protein
MANRWPACCSSRRRARTPNEQARRFYERRGFDEEARTRQDYGPEEDKVVFWKQLV